MASDPSWDVWTDPVAVWETGSRHERLAALHHEVGPEVLQRDGPGQAGTLFASSGGRVG